jgi:hypothetical protein
LRPRLQIHGFLNLKKSWCTGEDSNLRSSKERQIYSLLPLTTRPPVHNLKPSSNGHSLSDAIHSRQGQRKQERRCGMIAAGNSGQKLWSWRRDLNPRPSDYKSDALPAELRQPEQPYACLYETGSQFKRLPQKDSQWRPSRGCYDACTREGVLAGY